MPRSNSQALGASQRSSVVESFKKCLSEVNSTFGKSKKQTEFLLSLLAINNNNNQ